MPLERSQAADGEILSLIKELSGKLIERRRRREHVSQQHLARAVGCSERWLREIEAGIASATLDDHIRCAHSLEMTSSHLFMPLLAAEHGRPVPRELLLRDDLWEFEQEVLAVVERYQAAAVSRFQRRSGA
ncbi:helix-turn-helix domain-containing protein [Sphingomonas lycopersici]|nr:helix-turn-helix transcriptional regulator [Sphingomonas lycopersici]